jgi:hypothetical protein
MLTPGVCSVLQVKNVTGRLLVGLRWWNEGNSETGNAWRFESLAEVRRLAAQQQQGLKLVVRVQQLLHTTR